MLGRVAGEAVQAEHERDRRLGVVIGWEDQEGRALAAQRVDDVILAQIGDPFGVGCFFFAAGGEDQRQQNSKDTDFVVPSKYTTVGFPLGSRASCLPAGQRPALRGRH